MGQATMRQAFIAAVAALSLGLFGAAGPGFGEPAPQERKPAIVLAPPSGEAVEPEAPPAVEAEIPDREPPPIARKKPTPPPKKASVPQRAPQKPAAKKAPAKKAPARAAVSPAPQAKDCDYCYGCESLSLHCKRQWVCGRQYTERLAAGFCRR
jgi:outer membrane biosynthesis protein TonB